MKICANVTSDGEFIVVPGHVTVWYSFYHFPFSGVRFGKRVKNRRKQIMK